MAARQAAPSSASVVLAEGLSMKEYLTRHQLGPAADGNQKKAKKNPKPGEDRPLVDEDIEVKRMRRSRDGSSVCAGIRQVHRAGLPREEGVGQGGGGSGEGGQEGAANRQLLCDLVRAWRSDGAGHRDGTSTVDPVRLTRSPSLIAVSLPKTTIPIRLEWQWRRRDLRQEQKKTWSGK
ncbi:unnamed protein product [Urochloa humidicola]